MKTIFLDRDGVLNKKAAEHEYIKSVKDLHVLPGVPDAIKKLNDAGYRIIVVSNQQGVAKGHLTETDLINISTKLQEEIEKKGGVIEALFYCMHLASDNCNCRKPKTGMFEQAKEAYPDIHFDESVFIGDSTSDEHAAKALGMPFIRMQSDGSLLDAVQLLLHGKK